LEITRLGGDARRGRRSRLDAVIVNRDPRVRGPYTAFADVAGAYERGRPGYPDEAVTWLVGEQPRDVVDLGAGTGKFTRALAAHGHRVVAIEPLEEMRAQLADAVPGVRVLPGSAESMPLDDASADVVTSAQAFHWFDHDEALPEIARVLRPGGRLGLVWNSRDDRDPWMARLSAIIGNETIEESDVVPVIDASGLFEPVETATFAFEQVRDRDGLLDLVLSRSYLAKLTPGERQPVLDDVGALYDETATADGVLLAYVTECFRAVRRTG
jgi:ubiquinone/menaquinone biosynthesis C-methylase UbiE